MSHLDSSETQRALYRPFGAAVEGPPAGEGFGFTGQRLEADFGVYDYGARWYDPALGRFLQPDPLVGDPFDPQGLNRYSYVRNDPANRVDPTGLKVEDAPAFPWNVRPKPRVPTASFPPVNPSSITPRRESGTEGILEGLLSGSTGGSGIIDIGGGNSVTIARGKSVAKVEAGSEPNPEPTFRERLTRVRTGLISGPNVEFFDIEANDRIEILIGSTGKPFPRPALVRIDVGIPGENPGEISDVQSLGGTLLPSQVKKGRFDFPGSLTLRARIEVVNESDVTVQIFTPPARPPEPPLIGPQRPRFP